MTPQKSGLFLIHCLLISAWVLPIFSSFASTSSYYLDTSRMELEVNPQTNTASGSIKVNSNSEKPLRLKVVPKLWQLGPEGTVLYDAKSATPSLIDNIRVNPEEFDLLPGKARLVRFIVKVPEQPKDAEYPFQLYFEPSSLLTSTSGIQGTSVSNMLDVIPVFTTTVYAYQGNPTPAPKVEQFACEYTSKNQLKVDLALNNTGTKHARLFGNLILNLKKIMERFNF